MPFTRSFSARTDSGSANNPALNLTGDAAITISFVAETNTGGAGDLIFDKPGGGVDPDTQVEINGTSYDFTFEVSGTLPTLKKDGAQQVPDQFEGSAVYIVTVHDYPSTGQTTRFAFMPDETATLVEMDDFGNGAIDVQGVSTTPSGEAVCFAAGTTIRTTRGDVAVEQLMEGDPVITQDHGPQPIRWISKTRHIWSHLPHKSKPIMIAAGALGLNAPHTDLLVSPQHRILLQGDDIASHFGDPEVFAPACGLVALPGVRQMKGKRGIVYYHILLPRHAVIRANGVATESFFPGRMAVRALENSSRRELAKALAANRAATGHGYGQLSRRAVGKQAALQYFRKKSLTNDSLPIAA